MDALPNVRYNKTIYILYNDVSEDNIFKYCLSDMKMQNSIISRLCKLRDAETKAIIVCYCRCLFGFLVRGKAFVFQRITIIIMFIYLNTEDCFCINFYIIQQITFEGYNKKQKIRRFLDISVVCWYVSKDLNI